MQRILPIVLTTFFLPGCMQTGTTQGRPVEQSKVSQIVRGQTTASEIFQMFGSPTETTTLGRDTIYTYRYTEIDSEYMFLPYFSSGDTDTKTDELSITIDDGDPPRVKDYYIHRGTDE